jgi:hypothetical protein
VASPEAAQKGHARRLALALFHPSALFFTRISRDSISITPYPIRDENSLKLPENKR